jgi:NADH-quinone oxidoreductase subunit N
MGTIAATTTINPENLKLSAAQLSALLPYFWVFGGAILMMLLSTLRSLNTKWLTFLTSLVILVGGIVTSGQLVNQDTVVLFNGMMSSDAFSQIFNIVFLACAGLTILVSLRYLDREALQYPDYYILVIFSALGMMLMVSATDLIAFFLALEIMSLCIYVLVGFRRMDRRNNEAALKYFVLGGAASAVLLYGVALLYGATGTTQLAPLLAAVRFGQGVSVSPVFVVGVWLVIIGFLFKVAAVPFHAWMPDVYEGAPAPITGFMTTGVKAASFAAFVRILMGLGYGTRISDLAQTTMHNILWWVAVATLILGNVVALTQINLKRLLAYSSIAHTGYLLVGLLTASSSESGYAPIVMYLMTYATMNLGAFAILTLIAGREDRGLNLHDFSGLSQRQPWLAFGMSVFLFSMAGIPPTAGFAAKYYLLSSAVQAGEVPLVIISVLCSAVSVYYYLRVIVYMYMRDPLGSPAAPQSSSWATIAIAAMVTLTLQVGIMPERMLMVAKRAIASLTQTAS